MGEWPATTLLIVPNPTPLVDVILNRMQTDRLSVISGSAALAAAVPAAPKEDRTGLFSPLE